MNEIVLKQFVAGYADDASLIAFRWNGKHEEGFEDANEAYRSLVIDYVIDHPGEAPVALLTDLYRALTEYSCEAWGIDERVENIARLMLEKGGAESAQDFVYGAWQSYDAQSVTLFEGAPKGVIEECLKRARQSLEAARDDDGRAFWEFGVAHFETLLKYAA